MGRRAGVRNEKRLDAAREKGEALFRLINAILARRTPNDEAFRPTNDEQLSIDALAKGIISSNG